MRNKEKASAWSKAYVKTESGKRAKQQANLKFKAKARLQKLMPNELAVSSALLVAAMNNWR